MTGALHIAVVMKPLDGNFASNALKHDVAGLNIDGCRIGTETISTHSRGANGAFPKRPCEKSAEESGRKKDQREGLDLEARRSGRWPANVVLCHALGCKPAGTKKVKGYVINRWDDGSKPFGGGAGHDFTTHKTSEDGTETVDVWECVVGCPVGALDGQSGVLTSGKLQPHHNPKESVNRSMSGKNYTGRIKADFGGDTGGASRFFKRVSAYEEEKA